MTTTRTNEELLELFRQARLTDREIMQVRDRVDLELRKDGAYVLGYEADLAFARALIDAAVEKAGY
ncbi:hypothetical protein [Burkholderia gladioli]|uniref:hypothetical protein n=1 Tax=Burkholderia gladioli TaxID=28095 RepID=UPI00164072E0|nr:hypothetical protein [Burkholderia gladioli]